MYNYLHNLARRTAFRYLFIGGVGYLFELFIILIAGQLGASPAKAVAVSFILGTISAFLLQKFFTFKDRRLHRSILIPQVIATILLVIFNFCFSVGLAKIFEDTLDPIVSRTISLILTTIWNYLLFKTAIFNMQKDMGLSIKKSILLLKLFIKSNPIILIIFCVFVLISIAVNIYYYQSYYAGFDFAVFHEAIWKYSTLQWPDSSIRGLDMIEGDHFHPIIALLAPIYALVPSPYTLYFAQAFFIGLSIFPVYLFVKLKLNNTLSTTLITVAYALSIGLQWMIMYDFHETLFAIPLIAWSIYLIEVKNWKWLIASLLLLAVTKEEMYLYIFMVGILLIVTRRHVKLGVAISVLSLVGFGILKALIMPFLGGARSFDYWSYSNYGTSISNAAINALQHPLLTAEKLFGDIFSPRASRALFLWLAPLFFIVPLFSAYFILCLPFLITHFMSDFQNYSSHEFHYGGPLAPIFMLAFIDSIKRILYYVGSKKHPIVLKLTAWRVKILVSISILVVGVSIYVSYDSNSPFYQLVSGRYYNNAQQTKQIRKGEIYIQKLVGPNSSVLAPSDVIAHFSKRDKQYYMTAPGQWNPGSDIIVNVPNFKDVNYIILNTKLDLPTTYGIRPAPYSVLKMYMQELKKRNFTIIHDSSEVDGWLVYKNNESN